MPQTTTPFSSAIFQKFLNRLSDPSLLTIPAYNVAVVLAHPDDAVFCGATLTRLRGAHILAVTNGVRGGGASATASLPASRTPEMARWRELIAAAGLAGCPPAAVTGLAVENGKAAENAVAITRRVADAFHRAGTAIAITHAYEGADSDQDATAFAVHEAAALCRRRGQEIAILELALPGDRQTLGHDLDGKGISLPLTPQQSALKRRMLACFEPRDDLGPAVLQNEWFRVAPLYDFAELPRGRLIVYGDEAADLATEHWSDLVASAHRRLSGDETQRRHVV
jgi:LmbE family N-acetylglucosaminyl deacetylase